MANARKQNRPTKVLEPTEKDPAKLKEERAKLFSATGDRAFSIKVFESDIMAYSQRISQINELLRTLPPEPTKPVENFVSVPIDV